MKSLLVLFFVLITFPHQAVQAAESDTYDFSWLDPDKEVFVLQNRKYRKKGKVHINLGGGITTSGPFDDATALQGRVGYFFMEEWGFEILHSKNSAEENNTAKSVRNEDGVNTGGSIPFRRLIDSYTGAFILWSPFYAKINTFNKIIYMDWILGVGYGKIEETNNSGEFLSGAVSATPFVQESHNGIMWEMGFNFYINDSFSVRTDFTAVHYKATVPSSTTASEDNYHNYDLTIAFGFRF
ncbi:MAG: outer membrane beta-barrel domain-containing protein [Halobacteriovoraceae bacterium]|jgi:outer membrane beta-barrel protein|nr:outer membrane beta-barrel domain-containing protein [Halobacteriovoraceae bacterium]MBT5093815.1 outer membrane beta-barrel domain-containing protein [Halobacteriovoraceae bacterium]